MKAVHCLPATLAAIALTLSVSTPSDAAPRGKAKVTAKQSSKTAAKAKSIARTATRVKRNFRPNTLRKASHERTALKPTIKIQTWGINTAESFRPAPAASRPATTVKDPYKVDVSGAGRGTTVTVHEQSQSKDISFQGKPTKADVAKAMTWKKTAFEKHTVTVDSPTQTNSITRKRVLDTHTPFKATFKDSYGRQRSVIGNATGKQRTSTSVTTRNQIRTIPGRGTARGDVITTTSQGGEYLNAYKPWANANNIFVTPASRPFTKADYKQLASHHEGQVKNLNSQLRSQTKRSPEQTRNLKNDLNYSKTAAREAKTKVNRITRLTKTVAHLEGKLQTANKTQKAMLSKELSKVKAELGGGSQSGVRFLALAAFPANATVSFVNARLKAEGKSGHTVELKANSWGSLNGHLPAWQRDKIDVTVSFPAKANHSKGNSHEFSFELPQNSGKQRGFSGRGVPYQRASKGMISE